VYATAIALVVWVPTGAQVNGAAAQGILLPANQGPMVFHGPSLYYFTYRNGTYNKNSKSKNLSRPY
jgi:hypothetical protein